MPLKKFLLSISIAFFSILIFVSSAAAANFTVWSLDSNHDGTATMFTSDGGAHAGNTISWCRISDNFCNPRDLPILSSSGDGSYTFSSVDLGSFSDGYFGFNVIFDGSNNYVSGDISNTISLDGDTQYNPGVPTPTPTPVATPTTVPSSNSSSTPNSAVPSPTCSALNNQIIAPSIIKFKRISTSSISVSWGPYSGTDKFNVRYGVTNENWLYNTNVTGFSTTINALPPNQPVWVQIAATNGCSIGNYGTSKLVGGRDASPTVAPTGSAGGTLFIAVMVVLTILGGTILLFI